MTLERGELLNKRYRIIDILGQGGMGAVYRAVDDNLGIEVAVKENLFLTDEYARQFKREALILAGLRHPNLPRVADHFEIEHQGQYLVMDFIEGEDLRQRMERGGSLPEEEVVLIGAAMCDALAYLHTRKPPIVHRDIKPGNVKITPEGQIILVDFGLAKVMDDAQATSTGARAMTPGYSPPEQYGTARTDPRTDIYSLSATLYAALTGVIPEDGLARATGNANLTSLRKINPKVSRKLSGVIERGLSLHPDDRFQTAEEFKSALLDAHIEARNSMRREITITPPPQPEVVINDNGSADGSAGQTPGRALFPLMPAPVYIPARPWRNGTNWLALVLLVLILGTGTMLILNPAMLGQSPLAGIFMQSPTPTATPTIIPTQASVARATACVGPQCDTPASVPISTPEPTSTLAPSVVPTEEFTETPAITPTVTPVGGGSGEIAFASSRSGTAQVWTMDSNGGKLFQVTNMPDGACQPDWSPDGTRLVFTSPCPGKRDIYYGSSLYIIRRDGTGLMALPKSPEGDFDPSWAPDGNRIAYTSLKNNQRRIFILNVLDNSTFEVSKSSFADMEPSWSPSGNQLVFVRIRNSPEIWVMSDSGLNDFRFTISGFVADTWPIWAPDTRFIFFCQSALEKGIPWLAGQRYEDRGKMKEFRVPAGDQPQVGPVNKPSVSPDNNWIVYESWPDGYEHDIYRMTITGASPVKLTTDPGLDFDPSWQPEPIKP